MYLSIDRQSMIKDEFFAWPAMEIGDLDTPSLIVDLDTMERNMNRMVKFTRECGVTLRPHAKTHKVPEIAKMQLRAGSEGVCLQKTGEVEVFAANGINNIFLTNEVVAKEKLERLAVVAEKAHLGIAVDDIEVARLTGKVFREAGTEIDAYIDVDVGMHRCGIEARDAKAIAAEISRREGLTLQGIMGYEGNVNGARTKREQVKLAKAAMDEIVRAKREIERGGMKVDSISVGSSVSTWINAKHPDVTEVQPGMYIFNDHLLVERGVATWDDLALTVVATVMSKPAENRAVVDAGSKAFNFDTGLYPLPLEHTGVVMEHFSEEHGWLRLSGEGRRLKIGDKIRFVPAHCCTAVNQYDEMYGIRDGGVERTFSILARGKMR
jgi:D-serine deaminase-like pyridoxal phosphate-dependent protein